ncbi:hypothetical protein B0H14DRAFT_2936891 [Mycena olivaceomarginata]|nr:hypothetical protein B0H14DRAFT_2936891 [Mycena olivaceomarginata]
MARLTLFPSFLRPLLDSLCLSKYFILCSLSFNKYSHLKFSGRFIDTHPILPPKIVSEHFKVFLTAFCNSSAGSLGLVPLSRRT